METLMNLVAFGLASAMWVMAFAGLRTAFGIIARVHAEDAREERVRRDQFRGSPVNSATTQYSPAA